jgi:carboxymethylenebutenolidase
VSNYRDEKVTMPGGGEMNLAVWTPDGGSGPGILLIQEIFGIGDRLRAVGARLAAAGYVVAAPEVFWRFAPGWSVEPDEAGLQEAFGKIGQLDFPLAIADCGVALDAIATLPETTGTPAVLGFCLGGSLTFAVAADFEPSVAVSYYGSQVPAMLSKLDRITCPILFHFGSLDEYIPGEGVEALVAATAGRENTVVNIEIAGHAFDNEARLFYNESAAKSAWSKTLAFLAEHLPVATPNPL